MKKKILISILLLVCFWHFNVNAAEVLTEGVTSSEAEVTDVEETHEEEEEKATVTEVEEVHEEAEDSSIPPAPPDEENDTNVFLEENHENDIPEDLDEEGKAEEKNIDVENTENAALTDEEENNVETDDNNVEVDNNINNDIDDEVAQAEVVSEEVVANEETIVQEQSEQETTNEPNYLVTFINGDYLLNIQGGSNVLLSRVLSSQGIDISLSNIKGVRFSNDELLRITKLDSGDYNIESLQSFHTTEDLTIILNDDSEIHVTVIDGAEDDGPPHHKDLIDNGDGTYTLSLEVTGVSENKISTANDVNVLIIYDVSSSMTSNNVTTNPNRNRADYAEDVVHDFVNDLKGYQNTSDPSNIEVAVVTFGPNASGRQNWTSDLTGGNNGVNRFFNDGVDGTVTSSHNYSRNNGTNWEAAFRSAQTYLQALVTRGDTDPTFVILVTDGAPTAHEGEGGGAINPNQPPNRPWTDFESYYEAATDEAYGIQSRDNTTLFGIYAYGTEADLLDDLIYYSNTGSHREVDGTSIVDVDVDDYDFGGHAIKTENYFNAASTEDLNDAINKIFKKIVQALGVGQVTISDGTTSEVTVSTGSAGIEHMLDVDESSYEYWLTVPLSSDSKFDRIDFDTAETITYTVTDNGDGTSTITWGEDNSLDVDGSIESDNGSIQLKYKWTEANDVYDVAPPAAHLVDGAVEWNLKTVGTLLNGVTYTVTFKVWPSQDTLDLIADLKNNPDLYDSLTSSNKDYLKRTKNADGSYSYTLLTNTTTALNFKDTRENGLGEGPVPFNTVTPVDTNAVELLAITKEWKGTGGNRVELWVTRDGNAWYQVELKTENGKLKGHAAISIGIMTDPDEENFNQNIQILAPGHDYAFSELGEDAHHWEIRERHTIRPMLINGVLKSLILYEPEEDETPTGKYYLIDGKYYVVGDLNENEEAELIATNERRANLDVKKVVTGDYNPAKASFEFTITATSADSINPHDQYIWFTVQDAEENLLIDEIITALGDDYANGIVKADLENGQLRGTWYVANGQAFTILMQDGWNLRIKNLLTGSTYTITETSSEKYTLNSITLNGSEVASASGEISEIGEKLAYVFENEFKLMDVKVTKVWDDSEDTNGNRPNTISLHLNDEIQPSTYTLDDDGNWVYVYKNLPIYNDNGDEIEYTLTEDAVLGYTTPVITGSAKAGFVVTNSLETIKIQLEKVWNDSDDRDRKRGDGATIVIYTGSENNPTTVKSFTTKIDAKSDIYELPKYVNKQEVTYNVMETVKPTGYNSSVANTTVDGVKKYTVTNSYTAATTTVTVTKAWNDKSNQDGIRPTELTLTLNGLPERYETPTPTVTKNNNDTWTYTWSDLPMNEAGVAIEYSVTEENVPSGYTCTTKTVSNGGTITNSHTTAVTDVTVTKKWEDDGNRDKSRPDELTLTLNGVPTGYTTPTPTVTKDNNTWTYTWSGLPLKYNGSTIEYTVTEGTVPTGYTCEIKTVNAGGTITNVHTIDKTTVTVTKVWEDDSNRDKSRPDELTLTLNGVPEGYEVPTPTVTKNDDNTWTYTWTGLPANEAGEAIEYTVTEETVPTGYTCEITTVANGGTITNVHAIATTDVTVTKVWEDDGNRDKSRPTSLTLTVNGVPEGYETPTPTIDKDGKNWTYTWAGLPANEAGEEIEYTITEGTIPTGYTCETTTVANGGTITNVHTIDKTDVTVTKAWDDDSNRDKSRPDELTLTLNGVPEGYETPTPTVTKNDDNTWTYTWTGLPANEAGEAIEYTVTEGTVPTGYTCETTTVANGGTITNKHEVEKTSVTVKKEWSDNADQDGAHPTSIKVQLYIGDNKEGEAVELNADNKWFYTWTGLKKNSDGKEIEYSVKEVETDIIKDATGVEKQEEGKYYFTVSKNEDGSFTITNTYVPKTTSLIVTKSWDDDGDTSKRTDSVTITILANDKAYGDPIDLSEENGWTVIIDGLPIHEYDGTDIEYTVKEENVPEGYVDSYEYGEEDGVLTATVHNTLGQGEGEPPEPPVNPQTGDNIILYLITLLISLIGIVSGKYFLKEND